MIKVTFQYVGGQPCFATANGPSNTFVTHMSVDAVGILTAAKSVRLDDLPILDEVGYVMLHGLDSVSIPKINSRLFNEVLGMREAVFNVSAYFGARLK